MAKIFKDIPKHWKWVTLDEVSVTSSGGTPDRKNSNYFRGDIPWVKSGELNYNVITQTEEYITQEAVDYSSAKIFPKGTLLIALYGNTVGRMAFLGVDATTNQAVASIKSFGVNPKYLYYYLMSSKDELLNKREGSAQPNISQKVLNSFPFPVAPIEEQNRIVEKLEELFSELDKNLEQFEKSLKDVENLWTISLNKALGKNSKLVNLESLVEIKGGKRLPKNFSYSENKTEYPYIRVSDFSNYSVDESKLKYISEEVYEKLKTYSIDSENVYISIAGTIGLVGSIPNNLSNTILTENAAKFIFDKERLLKDYLIYLLDSPFVKQQINQSIKSTSQPKLALYKILEFKIPKHTILEQRAIVDKLEETKIYCNNLKKSINESYLASLMLKDKILQEAFQGILLNQVNTDTSTDILLKNIQNEKEQYLLSQQEVIKNRPKIKRMEKEKLSIIQVLEKNKKPISAKQLWEDSMYNDNIEKFYSELKKVQEKIIEEKTEKGSLISLK
ncbi:restriction endonuclease subunit S [Flavobacterium sp. MK4S-17]|uniref:restriction endonuclease subunit S n=1 Tax=Flavobacterium sp. MK4S-17 TaxID=2543737 RepID=UPI00135869D6|nr:restriction endonuclease subunit S [Flavobacterium sp. MK4S-17]